MCNRKVFAFLLHKKTLRVNDAHGCKRYFLAAQYASGAARKAVLSKKLVAEVCAAHFSCLYGYDNVYPVYTCENVTKSEKINMCFVKKQQKLKEKLYGFQKEIGLRV